MDQLSYTYKSLNFSSYMKAHFRKYLDKIYSDHNLAVDIERKLEGDKLTIYKVHKTKIFFKEYFFVEKLEIDRKEKTKKSVIWTAMYKEECSISQEGNDIKYIQKYAVPFFVKSKKKAAFDKGCEVIEKIVKELNLSLKF